MRENRPEVEVDTRARLRQVEDHLALQLAEREVAARPAETSPSEGLRRPIIPAPRRVPVYLRCHPQEGGFSELTITHPVVRSREVKG